MKQLLFLLLLMPCALFGQYNADNVLYNFMDDLKQTVSSVTELQYNADKNGKQEARPNESRVFLFNSNKQIREITWNSIKDNHELLYSYSFEASNPGFIKQETVEGDFVHRNTGYSYTQKNTQTGSTIFKNFSKSNDPFREFILDKNQHVVAVYEYFRKEKSYTANLYDYNSEGYMVKETTLYNGKPSEITTYKRNENGDIIEEWVFDVDHNKFDWKYEYTYTYDRYNNWVTKKKVMIGFNDKGKLITKKSDQVFEFYTREIKY